MKKVVVVAQPLVLMHAVERCTGQTFLPSLHTEDKDHTERAMDPATISMCITDDAFLLRRQSL